MAPPPLRDPPRSLGAFDAAAAPHVSTARMDQMIADRAGGLLPKRSSIAAAKATGTWNPVSQIPSGSGTLELDGAEEGLDFMLARAALNGDDYAKRASNGIRAPKAHAGSMEGRRQIGTFEGHSVHKP